MSYYVDGKYVSFYTSDGCAAMFVSSHVCIKKIMFPNDLIWYFGKFLSFIFLI